MSWPPYPYPFKISSRGFDPQAPHEIDTSCKRSVCLRLQTGCKCSVGKALELEAWEIDLTQYVHHG